MVAQIEEVMMVVPAVIGLVVLVEVEFDSAGVVGEMFSYFNHLPTPLFITPGIEVENYSSTKKKTVIGILPITV